RVGSGWTRPEKAAFTSELNFSDIGDPYISPDGSKLFFAAGGDLYLAERAGADYTNPRKLSLGINTEHREYLPSVANSGNLYFESIGRKDGYGQGDIYMARLEHGRYVEATSLGGVVNSEQMEESP